MCIWVAAIAAVAVSAYGAYESGQASKKAAKHNAKMDKYNAEMQGNQAIDALERGAIEADNVAKEGAAAIGEGRAAWAGGNVELSTGTAAMWEVEAAESVAADVGMTRYNAGQEAASFRNAAWNSRASASLNKYKGRSAARAGNIGAASSVLGGLSSVNYGR